MPQSKYTRNNGRSSFPIVTQYFVLRPLFLLVKEMLATLKAVVDTVLFCALYNITNIVGWGSSGNDDSREHLMLPLTYSLLLSWSMILDWRG